MPAAAILAVRNLTCAYGQQIVFQRVSAAITRPSLTAIVGPNGVGKSTLLKAIMGLMTPSSGSVRVFGKAIDAHRSRIAYIPQLQDIDWQFPLSALDVTLMGLYPRIGIGGLIRRHHKDEAMEWLGRVGMADAAHQPIGDLSGGQRQRVLIARSLAMQAQLYILDEPYNGIDDASRAIINELFQSMKSDGVAMLAVHHDLAKIAEFFDDVWLMSPRSMVCGACREVMTPSHISQAYGFSLLS